MKKLLAGRELLKSELPEKITISGMAVDKIPSTIEKNKKICCNRCQAVMTKVPETDCYCKKPCSYCRNCIQMGKVTECRTFYHLPETNEFKDTHLNELKWEGELSIQQAEASETIVESIQKKETRLLWAVAGAGKTEMLFKGIEYALKNKQRVCIASPRIDVCLELAPRLQAAFPQTQMVTLYGGMKEPYTYTQLVIATTHQLYRFREAFDVIIIDEVDAFPFHLDESLQFAAEKARKKEATTIYLSATPSQAMQKKVTKKQLKATILPARYHRFALPVPKTKMCQNWRTKLLNQPNRTTFGKDFKKKIESSQKCLVFAPNIEWMINFEKTLRKLYPSLPFELVHSQDPERKDKIMKMRENKLQCLLTTTILERGVTFPNIDVMVIGAEDRIFTESALVQISGRAGRSPKYPTGEVVFYHDGQSQAMKRAIKQIKGMNQLAKKRGLIK